MHVNPVADGWAGAEVQKPLVIQKGYGTNGPTFPPTRQGVVACPRLKKTPESDHWMIKTQDLDLWMIKTPDCHTHL